MYFNSYSGGGNQKNPLVMGRCKRDTVSRRQKEGNETVSSRASPPQITPEKSLGGGGGGTSISFGIFASH